MSSARAMTEAKAELNQQHPLLRKKPRLKRCLILLSRSHAQLLLPQALRQALSLPPPPHANSRARWESISRQSEEADIAAESPSRISNAKVHKDMYLQLPLLKKAKKSWSRKQHPVSPLRSTDKCSRYPLSRYEEPSLRTCLAHTTRSC